MLLFADGFDHYNVITDKWDYPGLSCHIEHGAGAPRTGIGCLQIDSSYFGPIKTFQGTQHVLVATNWYSNLPANVFQFANFDVVPPWLAPNGGWCLTLGVLGNGDVAVYNQILAFIAKANMPGLVTFNQYNSIAMAARFSLANGTVDVWVNGAHVLALTGVGPQIVFGSYAYGQYVNAFELLGPGGNAFTCYHDDVYLLDLGTPPNDSFLGALRIYALPPTDEGVVDFTPLVAPNWSEVNEIPPDGNTSYVSSPNPGDTDQYVYPLAGPPPASSLLFAEHDLDMEVDSGSRTVGSVVNGAVVEGAQALPAGYHIYGTPYDVNPATGVAFAVADFPIQAGPQVTA